MTGERARTSNGSLVAFGGVAGAPSALIFTVVHQLVISSIWFALPVMLAAGAPCSSGVYMVSVLVLAREHLNRRRTWQSK